MDNYKNRGHRYENRERILELLVAPCAEGGARALEFNGRAEMEGQPYVPSCHGYYSGSSQYPHVGGKIVMAKSPTNFDLLISACYMACNHFTFQPPREKRISCENVLKALHLGEFPTAHELKNAIAVLQEKSRSAFENSAHYAPVPWYTLITRKAVAKETDSLLEMIHSDCPINAILKSYEYVPQTELFDLIVEGRELPKSATVPLAKDEQKIAAFRDKILAFFEVQRMPPAKKTEARKTMQIESETTDNLGMGFVEAIRILQKIAAILGYDVSIKKQNRPGLSA